MVQRHWSPSKGSHSSGGIDDDDVSGYLPIKNKSLMKMHILKLTALQKEVIVDYSQKIKNLLKFIENRSKHSIYFN